MTTDRVPRRLAPAVAGLLAIGLLAAACGDDDDSSTAATTAAATTAASTSAATTAGATTTGGATTTASANGGVTAQGISDERCQQNKDAGKITFLTSFDFAAAASILDVVVAKDKGYFDKMCLNVELKPGFSTSNYPLVASGQGQVSSAGNYSEILNFSTGGAKFAAIADYGKIPIEALLVRDDGKINQLTDLKGKTIGVKGDIPPSLVAMLSKAGLKRGTDYKEVLLDGFDPKQHLQQAIDALPVYKSNEPGQLDAAGIKYKLFDPADEDTPGTFALFYATPDWIEKNPTAAQDFVRAAFKGYEDAVADPAGAVALSLKAINAAGNQNFLTEAGETYRWQQESATVKKGTPSGPIGLIDPQVFQDEVEAYTAAGVYKSPPVTDGSYDESVAEGLYDSSGKLIWPTS
jgi:ABC-type nitrate/sulfonate/bicarbonate transport system substrate-binding protein